jgi:nitrite reductase/ring-hydroxylating ferredoxin subunit
MAQSVSEPAGESDPSESITSAPIPDPGRSVRVPFGGTTVAVFNSGGRLYALEALCGHRKGPLDQGTVSDRAVACPWHGVKFDLETGTVVGGNFFLRRATRAVRTFHVRAVGGRVVLSERREYSHSFASPVGTSEAPGLVDPA